MYITMNITMLFLILSWCHVSFTIIFLWHCEQQNPGVWPINLISDDISYTLCLNPNIWSTLILLYWIVTLNIWFGYNMPFYKINWSIFFNLNCIKFIKILNEPWALFNLCGSLSWIVAEENHNCSVYVLLGVPIRSKHCFTLCECHK